MQTEPTFTPNDKILFSAGRCSPYVKKSSWPTIWMIDQDGKNKELIVPVGGSINPQISPDGTLIIYHEGFGLGSGIFYVKDPDGNGIWEDRDGWGVGLFNGRGG